jgi:hypothetical protein
MLYMLYVGNQGSYWLHWHDSCHSASHESRELLEVSSLLPQLAANSNIANSQPPAKQKGIKEEDLVFEFLVLVVSVSVVVT